jgi:IrrE N-terminal-like domain
MLVVGAPYLGTTPWCVRPRLPRLSRAGKVTTAVDWSGLRTRCQQRVDELLQHTGVPYPWDINQFLDRLERHRGRDIDLCAISWTVGDSCGAWQQREDHDVIAYAENTSGFHQDHIILHEIGHMILRHRGRCVLSEDEAARIAPDLAPAAFAHLLDRSTGQAEEHEAETIASLIHQRVRVRPQLTIDVVPPAAAQRLARVESIFGG